MNQQLLLDLLLPSPPTLDNFVVGANAAAVQAICTCPPGRAVYVWGSRGCGRSHLLQAIAHLPDGRYFGPQSPGPDLLEFATRESLEAVRVAVDDVDRLDASGQAGLFALYNRWRAQANSPSAFALFVSGPLSPMAMPVREDLRTRLGWDLVFRLEQLSDDERVQALHRRAADRGLTLAPDVLNWVMTHYARDMGQLTALIDSLDRYSLEKHRAITLPLVKDLLASNAQPYSTSMESP